MNTFVVHLTFQTRPGDSALYRSNTVEGRIRIFPPFLSIFLPNCLRRRMDLLAIPFAEHQATFGVKTQMRLFALGTIRHYKCKKNEENANLKWQLLGVESQQLHRAGVQMLGHARTTRVLGAQGSPEVAKKDKWVCRFFCVSFLPSYGVEVEKRFPWNKGTYCHI